MISGITNKRNAEDVDSATAPADRSPDRLLLGIRLALEVVVLVIFVYAANTARGFPDLASSFPFYASCVGAALTLVVIVLDVWRAATRGSVRIAELLDISSVVAETATVAEARRLLARAALYAGWLVGFLLLVALMSFPVATAVFIAVFLIVEGGVRVVPAVAAAIAGTGVLLLMSNLMDMGLPPAFWQ